VLRTALLAPRRTRLLYLEGIAVDTDLARHVLPKNFLRPCLLLLLHERPAHGYDLRERLRPLGFSRDDPGRLYRALRALEGAGLVRSTWQSSTGGPDRRMYELTRAGEERLRDTAAELQAMHTILDTFLCRCSAGAGLDATRGSD
jgi:PadR family transcriptional regulator PadR